MFKVIKKLNSSINKFFIILSLIFLAFLTISIAIQVYTRYVMGSSLSGTEEFARYCFIWLTMLGASICVNEESHATVSILNDNLKGNMKKVHILIIDFLVIVTATILFIYGIKMVLLTTNQLTPSLHIPMAIVYLSLPIGAIGMIIGMLNNMIIHFTRKEVEGDKI